MSWVGSDGLVRSRIRDGIDFVLEDSIDALDATKRLAKTLPTGVIVDCAGVRSASRESREFWSRAEALEALSCMAIVVTSPIARVIASFFVRLVRPGFNVKLFSSELEAVEWVRSLSP
ncbi:MAG: hypothetical protein U0165_06240 [Polyangiaceae bacterium]